MKKILMGAAVVGVLFVFIGGFATLAYWCTTGSVSDKRAPGYPGDKTYQILLNPKCPGLHQIWLTVPEKVWDRCEPHDTYSAGSCSG